MPHSPQHEATADALLSEIGIGNLIALAHERKRKTDHAEAKGHQPPIEVSISPQHWAQIVAVFRQPIRPDEQNQGGLDYLCQSVIDCMEANAIEDTFFAMARVVRKVWALQPHLGPIERKL